MTAQRELMKQTADLGEPVAPFIRGYLARWQPYKPGWVYEDGIIFKGALDLWRATGDGAFLDFVNERVAPRIAADGSIEGYAASEFNIDNICAGKVLFTLLENTGEVWYAEAVRPEGPYGPAVKIVQHNQYNFYNVLQHPLFEQDGGRILYFEGTYTDAFTAAKEKTPRYNYNQIMYRLQLDDPALKDAQQR